MVVLRTHDPEFAAVYQFVWYSYSSVTLVVYSSTGMEKMENGFIQGQVLLDSWNKKLTDKYSGASIKE